VGKKASGTNKTSGKIYQYFLFNDPQIAAPTSQLSKSHNSSKMWSCKPNIWTNPSPCWTKKHSKHALHQQQITMVFSWTKLILLDLDNHHPLKKTRFSNDINYSIGFRKINFSKSSKSLWLNLYAFAFDTNPSRMGVMIIHHNIISEVQTSKNPTLAS
jgi:hypothetical protein